MTGEPAAPAAAPAPRFPQLAERLGDRFSESPFERSFYTRDLASVPPFLGRLLARTTPDAVARPANAAEVAELVRYAGAHSVPITPRAAATTVYWNAVPMRAGLVLDLNGLRGRVAIDEAALTATVLPGTRWEDLDRTLGRRGYAVLSYPTSAPSATVGGWFSMEGYGIGSLQHGGLAEQVTEAEVVLPDGQTISARSDAELSPAAFAGAEGTLGIVTSLTLRIRPKPAALGHELLVFDDLAALQGAAVALAAGHPKPYLMHFAAPSFGRLMAEAGFAPASESPLLAITFQGSAEDVAAGAVAVRTAAAAWHGRTLPQELAHREWDERFFALRIKRTGPTVLGAESWLPLDRIAAYEADAARLGAAQRLPLATYGTVVAPGWATVMSLYPCDESQTIPYVLALSLTRQLYRIAFRHGGRPYGVGLWNTPYLGRAFSPSELAERRTRKRRLDPAGIMNPGKAYAAPWLLSPAIFGSGMDVLALARRAMSRAL